MNFFFLFLFKEILPSAPSSASQRIEISSKNDSLQIQFEFQEKSIPLILTNGSELECKFFLRNVDMKNFEEKILKVNLVLVRKLTATYQNPVPVSEVFFFFLEVLFSKDSYSSFCSLEFLENSIDLLRTP